VDENRLRMLTNGLSVVLIIVLVLSFLAVIRASLSTG
jgi:hypothetical protein